MKPFKEREVHLNTKHYAVSVKENPEGIIIDIFHRHGDLIDTYTYWNDDVIDDSSKDFGLAGGEGII